MDINSQLCFQRPCC